MAPVDRGGKVLRQAVAGPAPAARVEQAALVERGARAVAAQLALVAVRIVRVAVGPSGRAAPAVRIVRVADGPTGRAAPAVRIVARAVPGRTAQAAAPVRTVAPDRTGASAELGRTGPVPVVARSVRVAVGPTGLVAVVVRIVARAVPGRTAQAVARDRMARVRVDSAPMVHAPADTGRTAPGRAVADLPATIGPVGRARSARAAMVRVHLVVAAPTVVGSGIAAAPTRAEEGCLVRAAIARVPVDVVRRSANRARTGRR